MNIQNFKNKKTIIIAVVIIAVVVLGYWWYAQATKPGAYDDFAKCLKEKNAIFYGAFWCPHCQDQKQAFGGSAKYLLYVECSTQDAKSQLPVCQEAQIQSYPTWKFADGSILEGDIKLEKLTEKTGCALPQ